MKSKGVSETETERDRRRGWREEYSDRGMGGRERERDNPPN